MNIWYRLKVWDLRFLQRCCWRFESSEVWHFIVGLVVLTVSKDHCVCVCVCVGVRVCACSYLLNNAASHLSSLSSLEWWFARPGCWGEYLSWLEEVTRAWRKLCEEEPHDLIKLCEEEPHDLIKLCEEEPHDLIRLCEEEPHDLIRLYKEEPQDLIKLRTGWAEHVMYVKCTRNVKKSFGS